MDVKWTVMKAKTSTTLCPDYLGAEAFYRGGHCKMQAFGRGTAPGTDEMGDAEIPSGFELIIMGGRSSIADAVKLFGPLRYITDKPTSMCTRYFKSGTWRSPNYTLVVISDTDLKGNGFRTAGMYDIIFGDDRITPSKFFMARDDIVQVMRSMKD